MKKILIVIMTMFMLCSCSGGKVTESEDVQLKMLTRGTAGLPIYNSYTDDGYYEIMNRTSVGGSNIMYTDFATCKQIYLCNRPECYHNDENCPSYFPGNCTPNFIFMDKSGTKLLSYVSYRDEEDNYIYQLYSMNTDGSERKMICDLGSAMPSKGHIVGSDDKIYNVILRPNFEKKETEQKLISIDLSSGEKEELYTFENGEKIVSACGSRIYLDRYNSGKSKHAVDTIDLATGERKEVYSYSNYKTDGMVSALEAVFDENYMYYVIAEDDTYNKINLDTGERQVLISSLSKHIDTQNSIYPVDIMDNHIFVQNVKTADENGYIESHWYMIDMLTGQIIEQDIEYYQFDERRVAYPVARFKDSMLIIYNTENVTVTLYGPGNTPYEVQTPVYKYGVISKSDFYSNINNIQPVENAV